MKSMSEWRNVGWNLINNLINILRGMSLIYPKINYIIIPKAAENVIKYCQGVWHFLLPAKLF